MLFNVDIANGNDSFTGVDWNHAVKTLKHALTLECKTIYIAQGTCEESEWLCPIWYC